MRRYALVFAAAATILGGALSPAGAQPPPGAPVAVVRAYMRGLDARSARAVCATFAVQLRHELHSQGVPTCLASIDQDFRFSRRRDGSFLRGARLVRLDSVTWNPTTRVDAVASTVEERFGCHGDSVAEPSCRPATRRREDLVYVLLSRNGWKIVQPGGLLYPLATGERGSPPEPGYFPPGNSATVSLPAAIEPPSFSCDGQQVRSEDPAGDVRKPYYGGPVAAPWLDIRGFAISRPQSGSLCFRVELSAPPRAGSHYGLDVAPARQPWPIVFAAVDIDGLGMPHVTVLGHGPRSGPEVQRALPRIGLVGSSLEILVSAPLWPASEPALVARVESASRQPGEPLLSHPLAGEDVAPNEACLAFPSGTLVTGVCGSEPGG